MALFREINLTIAQSRLVSKSSAGSETIAAYEKALLGLTADRSIELVPDPGEKIRSLKLQMARAIKSTGVPAVYGESAEGSLIVWIDAEAAAKASARKATAKFKKSIQAA